MLKIDVRKFKLLIKGLLIKFKLRTFLDTNVCWYYLSLLWLHFV